MFLSKLRVGVVALCACVGVSSGATTKIEAFMPAGVPTTTDCQGSGDCGQTKNPNVDGTGTLKYMGGPADWTRIHIQIADLEPSKPYSVMVEGPAGTRTILNAFVTNPAGHGVFMSDVTFLPGDWTDSPTVVIFRWDGVVEDFVAVHTGDRETLDCWHETRAVSVLR